MEPLEPIPVPWAQRGQIEHRDESGRAYRAARRGKPVGNLCSKTAPLRGTLRQAAEGKGELDRYP
jgi:hypothetical protein